MWKNSRICCSPAYNFIAIMRPINFSVENFDSIYKYFIKNVNAIS